MVRRTAGCRARGISRRQRSVGCAGIGQRRLRIPRGTRLLPRAVPCECFGARQPPDLVHRRHRAATGGSGRRLLGGSERTSGFFFEEAVEDRAGVVGVLGDGSLGGNRTSAVSSAAVRGVAGDRYARLKEFAFIGRVLWRNPDRNRLQALEPGGGLEVGALFAAMQGHAALGTVAAPINLSR